MIYKAETIMNPILKVKKLRLIKIQQIAPDHTEVRGRVRIQNQVNLNLEP